MISFKCSLCKQPLQLEDGSPGQEIRCFRCGKHTHVPSRLHLLLRDPRRLCKLLTYVLAAAGLMFFAGQYLLRSSSGVSSPNVMSRK